MTDVPTYKAPDGVNGPTLGGYLPEGCDRLGATCVPQNESTWVPWSDNSRERIVSESLYWWRLPAFKKGDRVQIFVPPWPGAVLSGLTDEDGEPTWLAQAGDVRGEQARIWHGDVWNLADVWDHRAWVEVRAPRAVPEPERVSAVSALADGLPWPGAVLSGLVDEDGEPTWLALAPNVLGEAVRTCIDFPWFICGSDNAVTPYWVEVRAPRAVPEPETERERAARAFREAWVPKAAKRTPWEMLSDEAREVYFAGVDAILAVMKDSNQ